MSPVYSAFAAFASQLGSRHARTLATLAIRLAGTTCEAAPSHSLMRTIMGLKFPSPVGLAAGFDKHGELYPYLARLGLGFAEIGTTTLQPETGRSRGIKTVMSTLSRCAIRRDIPLGLSISMNRATLPEAMAEDYVACMSVAWHKADYIVLNLGVRAGPDLHQPEYRPVLRSVLAAAKREQSQLATNYGFRLPLVVKIDDSRGNTCSLIALACEFGLDGMVLSSEGHEQSLYTLEQITHELQGIMPIIAVGGIRTPQDAADRLHAGAALVQLHTGLMKSGPSLVRHINVFLDGQAH